MNTLCMRNKSYVKKILTNKISHNSIETTLTMNRPTVFRMLTFSVQMVQYYKTTSPLIEKNLQNISFKKKRKQSCKTFN